MKIKTLMGILTISLGLLACKNNQAGTKDGNQTNDLETPAFNEKLNAYIAVHNYVVAEYKGSSFFKSLAVFHENFGAAGAPNVKQESPNTFLGNNYNWGIKMAVDPALKIAQSAPDLGKLDSLEIRLSNDIIATNKLLDEFFAYYNQKSYLTDQFKKAAELHAAITAAAAKTRATYYEADAALKVWVKKRDMAGLDKIKEKQPINYYMKTAMLHAEAILDEFKTQDVHNENIVDLNTTPVKISLEELKKCAAELYRLGSDEKELAKSGINTASTFQNFKKYVDSYIGTVNLIISKVQQKQSFSDAELKKMEEKDALGRVAAEEGSVNMLIRQYNEMVDEYNLTS